MKRFIYLTINTTFRIYMKEIQLLEEKLGFELHQIKNKKNQK